MILPPARILNEFDPIRECVPKAISVSFLCDESKFDACDDVFTRFSEELSPAKLKPRSFKDSEEYEGSLRFGTKVIGARVESPTHLELDMDTEKLELFSNLVESGGMTCHMVNDPQCAPVVYLRSCVAAVQTAALRAMRVPNESVSDFSNIKFRLFPQQRKVVSGIADTSLSWIIPLYLSGLFLNLYNFALIELVSEKEGRHRDYLVGWGITRRDHFVAWLVTNGFYGLVAVAFTTYGVVHLNVFSEQFFAELFLGFLSYFTSLLSLAYILSIKITSVRTAANIASFTDIIFNAATLSAGAIHNRLISLLVAIVPTVPFFFLIQAIAIEEAHGTAALSSLSCVILSILSTALFIGSALRFCRKDMTSIQTSADSWTDHGQTVTIRNLTKRYPEAEQNALTNVSLQIHPGEVHSLIGANGAGKTTLINNILRLQAPSSCSQFGVPDPAKIALCLQEDAVWELLSVKDHIMFFANDLAGIDEAVTNELVAKMDLQTVLDQECTTLSGGQKRRLSVLLAVAKARKSETELIIFDEPTTGIDVEGRRVVWDLIRDIRASGSKAVLLTTHYLDEAQALSDRVTFLGHGEVKASGTVRELQESLHSGYLVTVKKDSIDSIAKPSTGTVFRETSDSVVFKFALGAETEVTDFLKKIETQDALIAFESMTLDNMFMQLREDEVGVSANRSEDPVEVFGIGKKASWTSQVGAMTRVRVKPKISSIPSILSNIVLPMILISFSLIARNIGFSFAPRLPDVEPQIVHENVQDLVSGFNGTVTGESVGVPFLGEWRGLPLPNVFEPFPLPQDSDMMEFLWDTRVWFPFAIDFENNHVWVNPRNPKSLIPLLSFFTSHGGVEIKSGAYLSDAQFNAIVKSSVIGIVIYVVISLSVIATQCATQIFDERKSLVKRLSQIQGLKPSAYWAGSVFGHVLLNAPVLLMAPVTAVLTLGPVISDVPGSWFILSCSAIVNSFQLVLFGYLFSLLFKTKESLLKFNSLFTVLIYETVVIGGVLIILTFFRTSFPVIVFWLSLLVPPFNMAAVISQLAAMHMNSCSITDSSCYWDKSLWEAGVWIPILAGILQAGLIIFFLIVLEKKDQSRLRNPLIADCAWALDTQEGDTLAVNPSVKAEEDRIMKGCDDKILFLNLWHCYTQKQDSELKWVVRDLTLGVKPGETLGLLGKNGAGKTTALSTLLGMNRQIAGYAGVWPGKSIGFCPQTNSLWDGLSGIDHIRFYATLRGCWTGRVYGEKLLRNVGIDEFDKVTKSYSGGIKRRLCIAIALVGNAEVLILDEPTAGVDVGGKREIWEILHGIRDMCSVIITTHSLEEADALATRVGIMNAGRLVQVGTPTELRNMVRKLRIAVEPALSDEEFVHFKKNFVQSSGEVVRDPNGGIEIDMQNLSASHVLTVCEHLKSSGAITHFSVQQLSLEDIFLKTIEG
jgi:ATP-binding cassette subfamily A (ABC1) protein 3